MRPIEKFIKKRMRALEIKSVTDLAEMCGLSHQTIYEIFNGRSFTERTAAKLAKVLMIEVKTLFNKQWS